MLRFLKDDIPIYYVLVIMVFKEIYIQYFCKTWNYMTKIKQKLIPIPSYRPKYDI